MDDRYLRKIVLEDAIAHDRTYIRDLPVVRSLRERDGLELCAPVTFLVGENGTGKSTLLEAVAVAWGFNPEGGSRNFTFSTRETHAGLHRYIRLVRGAYRARGGFFLRAESFYNVASEIDRIPDLCEDAYGGRSLHECRMERVFWLFCKTVFTDMDFMCWTNRKLRCLRLVR